MSLQIWLPLNGNFNNLGTFDLEYPDRHSCTVNAYGKTGSCYYFSAKQLLYRNVTCISPTEWSVAAWVKPMTASTSSHQYIVSMNTAAASDFTFSICWFTNYLGIRTGSTTYTISNEPDLINKWTHICGTYKDNVLKIYLNGVLKLTQENPDTPIAATNLICGRRLDSGGNYYGYLNDIRIYDNCLSAAEVHEIAQGLIMHYPLNQNLTPLENVYGYPTFDTSDNKGGWQHWGRTGAEGIYGQNTDKKYIYNKNNTYSHWIANSGTAAYLLYKTVSFAGGYRSIQCILKEENSTPIDENIIFPSWNSDDNGAEQETWTSITNLGDGFYLCKVEGLKQTTENMLTGIYLNPGYKVYISEMYLENRDYAADLFQQDNIDTIFDVSGYGHHGIMQTNTLAAALDSPRYSRATIFPGTSDGYAITENYLDDSSNRHNEFTWAGWVKVFDTNAENQYIQRNIASIRRFENNKVYISWTLENEDQSYSNVNTWNPNFTLPINTWQHIAFVFKNGIFKFYSNGQYLNNSDRSEYGTYIRGIQAHSIGSSSFNGALSDVRLYTTALSDDDILHLYNTSLKIDNGNNLHTYEIQENKEHKITKTGILKCSNIFENAALSYLKYDPNIYIEPDGSCWMHIFHHNNPGNAVFNSTNDFAHSVYLDENRWFNVEVCNWVNKWELMVKFKYTIDGEERKIRWIQNVNPMIATYEQVGSNNITQIINDEYLESQIYGLYRPTSENTTVFSRTYLAGNNGSVNNWWGATGSYVIYNDNSIPGWTARVDGKKTTTTGYNDLYLRIDNLNSNTPSNVKNTKNNIWVSNNFIEI